MTNSTSRPLRKLNLGCGFDKRAGFTNADSFTLCEPDILFDIETTPWPIGTDAYDYVLMKHVLEHVGATFDVFAKVLQEIYRITAPGGHVEIHVPSHRHDSYWSDPTHVRVFTSMTFRMLSKSQNDRWIASRSNFTMLAHLIGVDFEVVKLRHAYDPDWQGRLDAGEISLEALEAKAATDWNVVREMQVLLRVVK